MSYIEMNLAERTDIVELSLTEIDEVAGGPGPILAFFMTPPGAALAGAVVGAVATIIAGNSNDDCTTYTRTWTDSNGVKHEVVQKVCD